MFLISQNWVHHNIKITQHRDYTHTHSLSHSLSYIVIRKTVCRVNHIWLSSCFEGGWLISLRSQDVCHKLHKRGRYPPCVLVRVPSACICNGNSFRRLYNNVDHWESDYHMGFLTVFLSLNTTVISFSAPSFVEPTWMIYYPTESPEAESKNSKGILCCFPHVCPGWGIRCNRPHRRWIQDSLCHLPVLVVVLCDCYPLVSDGIWSATQEDSLWTKENASVVCETLLKNEAQHAILLQQTLFPYFLLLLSFRLQWCLLTVVKLPRLTAGIGMQGSLHCAREKTRDRSSHYWIVMWRTNAQLKGVCKHLC